VNLGRRRGHDEQRLLRVQRQRVDHEHDDDGGGMTKHRSLLVRAPRSSTVD
jgi:hypothetical protein